MSLQQLNQDFGKMLHLADDVLRSADCNVVAALSGERSPLGRRMWNTVSMLIHDRPRNA